VKKFGVSIALLEPLDARFLFPQNLFLSLPGFQLLAYSYFLGFKIFSKSMLPDLSLYNAHLICQLLLGVKNIAKGFPVPESELLLKILEPLLESVHLGAMRYRCFPPPLMDIFVKIWVAELEFLEPEGFSTWGGQHIQP
jgi:hypothetical protein